MPEPFFHRFPLVFLPILHLHQVPPPDSGIFETHVAGNPRKWLDYEQESVQVQAEEKD